MDNSNDTPIISDEDTLTITSDAKDIDLSSLSYSIDMSTLNIPSLSSGAYTITTNNTSGGSYLYTSNGMSGTWSTTPTNSGALQVNGDAEFSGDIKWRGRSLEKMLQKIEDRLAIIQDPDPAKLEKYAALKKAYEHYKTLERLIGDD